MKIVVWCGWLLWRVCVRVFQLSPHYQLRGVRGNDSLLSWSTLSARSVPLVQRNFNCINNVVITYVLNQSFDIFGFPDVLKRSYCFFLRDRASQSTDKCSHHNPYYEICQYYKRKAVSPTQSASGDGWVVVPQANCTYRFIVETRF